MAEHYVMEFDSHQWLIHRARMCDDVGATTYREAVTLRHRRFDVGGRQACLDGHH